jgi:hypothetical protein
MRENLRTTLNHADFGCQVDRKEDAYAPVKTGRTATTTSGSIPSPGRRSGTRSWPKPSTPCSLRSPPGPSPGPTCVPSLPTQTDDDAPPESHLPLRHMHLTTMYYPLNRSRMRSGRPLHRGAPAVERLHHSCKTLQSGGLPSPSARGTLPPEGACPMPFSLTPIRQVDPSGCQPALPP